VGEGFVESEGGSSFDLEVSGRAFEGATSSALGTGLQVVEGVGLSLGELFEGSLAESFGGGVGDGFEGTEVEFEYVVLIGGSSDDYFPPLSSEVGELAEFLGGELTWLHERASLGVTTRCESGLACLNLFAATCPDKAGNGLSELTWTFQLARLRRGALH
jgi:hypothetical protein